MPYNFLQYPALAVSTTPAIPRLCGERLARNTPCHGERATPRVGSIQYHANEDVFSVPCVAVKLPTDLQVVRRPVDRGLRHLTCIGPTKRGASPARAAAGAPIHTSHIILIQYYIVFPNVFPATSRLLS
jgi:hypothetical protein